MTRLDTLLAGRDWLLADGATGTNLFAMGLEAGEAPELWNETEPAKIRALYDGAIEAGPESLEVGFFAWEEIPWSRLAFPSVAWALEHHRELAHLRDFSPRSNPPGAVGHLDELKSLGPAP